LTPLAGAIALITGAASARRPLSNWLDWARMS
jgi:hypothetical protein